MLPAWTLTTLGFIGGTLFGALALGELGRSPTDAGLGPSAEIVQAPSDRRGAAVVQPSAAAPVRIETAQIDKAPTEKAPEPPAPVPEDPRMATVLASWRAAEARIADLQARLSLVERTLAERTSVAEGPRSPQTVEERRDLLVAAGVGLDQAEDILWRESRAELDRLGLRDQAIREGWMGTDRYREALNALSEDGVSLRQEIGDAAWDRYLYLTGEDNRVSVSSVIPGSAAEAAGLLPGDLIESYAGSQPFGFNDLRQATTEGEKGELVAVRIRRGQRVLEAWVPRGPLGVRMGMGRAEPLP